MAILSLESLFSDNQAITATAASTNVYDRLAPGTPYRAVRSIIDDLGNSHVPLFFQVTEDFDNLTSLTVTLEQDSDEAFGSPTTAHEETIVLADLVKGKKFNVRAVPHQVTERYLRFNYTVTGTAPSAGKVTAGLGTCQEDSWGTR